jgi:hypothetical protein
MILNNTGAQINANAVIPSNSLPRVNGVPVLLPYGCVFTARANILNNQWGPVFIQYFNNTTSTINIGQDIPSQLLPYIYANVSNDDGFTKRSSQLFGVPLTGTGAYTANGKNATFQFTAITPLKYLHTFFDVLDIPLYNCRMQFTINTSFKSGGFGLYCPIQSDYWDLANGGISLQLQNSNTWLYYPSVEFTSDLILEVGERMKNKNLHFKYSFNDWTPYLSLNQPNTVMNAGMLLSSSQKKPVKLWAMIYDTGAMVNTTVGAPNTTFVRNEPLISNNKVSNFNVLINDNTFFMNDLQTPYEVYKIFQQNLPDGGEGLQMGSRINFSDFQKQYNIVCVDLTRHPMFLNQNINTVDLRCRGNITSSGNVDILYLVEYQKIVSIDIANGSQVQVQE